MALTKVTGQVINDTTGLVVGVTTVGGGLSATDGFFSGIVTAVGDASFSGNVSVGGTLTYEDVTNIDAVGLITARNGVVVGSGITLSKDGDGFFTGVITATSYSGIDLSAVTGATGDFSIADKIVHTGDTDTAIRFPSADTITAETGGTERLRITSDGKYQFPGTGGGSGARGLEIDTESIGAADEGVILNARASGTTGQIKLQTNSATAVTVEGNGGNVNVASNLKVAGVCTATSFSGSGANLTGISAGVVKAAVRRYYGFLQVTGISNSGFTQIDQAYVDITPTSSSNYIKLGGLFTWEGSDTEAVYSFRWKKVVTGGSTTSIDSSQASGNRPSVTYKELGSGGLACTNLDSIYDLADTTSSIRYYLEVFCDGSGQTLYLNRTHADLNDPRDERGASYFVAEEINNSIFTFTNDS